MAESHKCFLLISGRDSRLHRFAKTIKNSGRSILFAFSIAEAAQKSKGSRKKISGNSVHKSAYLHLSCAVSLPFFPVPAGNETVRTPFRSNNIGSETRSENVFNFHRNVTKSIRNAQFRFPGNGQNAKLSRKAMKVFLIRLIFDAQCAIMKLRKRLSNRQRTSPHNIS